MADRLRVGICAPKVSFAYQRRLLDGLGDVDGDFYRPDHLYDLVWFINASPEMEFLRRHTDTAVALTAMEPPQMWPLNADANLLVSAHRYFAISNLGGTACESSWRPFHFPAAWRKTIEREFPVSLARERSRDFCIFAAHDPNLRQRLGELTHASGGIAAGRLFDNPVAEKLPLQRQCRFEFITENVITDWYWSEKITQSLLAGCVPVYWGARSIKAHIPPEMFVDVWDFCSANGVPDLDRLVAHCLAPGVYERCVEAIQSHAGGILAARFSIESCLTEPIKETLGEMRARSRLGDPVWWARRFLKNLRKPRVEPECRFTLRQRLGALLIDGPPFLAKIASEDKRSWLGVRNRRDKISFEKNGGAVCAWEGTRTLHLCEVFPASARMLQARALREHPIEFASTAKPAMTPQVSFIIGHRGVERLLSLLLVIRSIAAQTEWSVECIVVEQDASPLIRDLLPDWVRYVFTASAEGARYNRSAAFNAGARVARGDVLILHDNDLCVPVDYASSHCRVMDDGYDVANRKRFVFYQAQSSTDRPSERGLSRSAGPVEHVLQNACGGGSIAIRASAFRAIGGMDEGFSGWGGEDVEFWDRCQSLAILNSQTLPLLHLWHESQEGKRMVAGNGLFTADYLAERMRIAREVRIAQLREVNEFA